MPVGSSGSAFVLSARQRYRKPDAARTNRTNANARTMIDTATERLFSSMLENLRNHAEQRQNKVPCDCPGLPACRFRGAAAVDCPTMGRANVWAQTPAGRTAYRNESRAGE